MKKYGQDHQDCRSAGSFEAHSRSRDSGGARRGRAWRFMGGCPDFCEPHYRVTSRMAALPGGHVRQVREPERSPHGR